MEKAKVSKQRLFSYVWTERLWVNISTKQQYDFGVSMSVTEMDNVITFIFPSNTCYISTMRILLGDLAEKENFSYQDIEDMKVAVSEACSNAILHGYSLTKSFITIDFELLQDRMIIKVTDHGRGLTAKRKPLTDKGEPTEKGLGLGIYLMQTLMDKVEYSSPEDHGTVVKLTKRK
ncbi:MAG: ATP-binding protein [bacterium]|jgi:serine/threonine-protein kinase RsbW|nr:ATP-binding protein [bacterium]